MADYTIYENFEHLKNVLPNLAQNLLKERSEGEWMDDSIFVYDSLKDFAEYEMTEGFYADYFSSLHTGNLWGAPNPLDYIDFEALGESLSNNWDESVHALVDNMVVSTSTGW